MLADQGFLRTLRRREVEGLAGELPPASRVLEIGAGTGAQARILADLGHRVVALDVESSRYLARAEFDVQLYDGRTLPFPADRFDAVFSSNVLEHVVGLDGLLAEMRRVLVPGGRAVHVLPTSAWRLWTSLAHYPWLLTFRWCRPGRPGTLAPAAGGEGTDGGGDSGGRSAWRSLRLALAAPRHGEEGNALWELWGFSRRRWLGRFRRAGFTVEGSFPNRLFYTGYLLFGARLPLPLRARLSRLLGSATRTYVLRNPS